MKTLNFAAVDLGASSGRVMLARFDGGRLSLEESHRFPNGPVGVLGSQHWDVLRLFAEIKHGLALAARPAGLDGIGLDTWGLDFALLDREQCERVFQVADFERRPLGGRDRHLGAFIIQHHVVARCAYLVHVNVVHDGEQPGAQVRPRPPKVEFVPCPLESIV